MIEFSEEYYRSETIEGFPVTETMKRCWAANFEVLSELDRICSSLGIRYCAAWGTLLGTVRHKGFVPWDDDVDIAMLRPDLNRLMKMPSEALPQGWSLHSCHNTDHYHKTLYRLITGTEIDISEEHLKNYHGFPYPIGIDISPVDFIPRQEEEREMQKAMYLIAATGQTLWTDPTASAEERERQARITEENLGVTLDREGDMAQQFTRLMDAVSAMYGPEEGDTVGEYHYIAAGNHTPKPVSDYLNAEKMIFGPTMIRIPLCYEELLRERYGDYHKFIRGASSHDYPYYKDMEKRLKSYEKV